MIGCGKMGEALLGGWSRGDDDFTLVDPGLEEAPHGAILYADAAQLGDRTFDAVVCAVKPQMIDTVMPGYTDHYADDAYLLSIAAGASIDRLKAASGGRPVIRVMPNLPAAVGRGVSGLVGSADATGAQLAHAQAMMERCGTAVTVESEDMLDRVTAVAGSGPGYVFEMARSYVEAAKDLGFTHDQARAMVLGTLEGTIAMALRSDSDLETLRNSVTSKGGTTAAGLNALNGGGEFSALIAKVLGAAYDRAVELR
ncbi:pyrroline-5-carboxylate reductase family protein [Aurantiacibacter spongiae]|uniref:Pyrroline-5-carboxylate reductase n=1 Tax=Aurantiacibacter spongiae TaxID=2488860 RepID=A0A3N5DP14_9SPHN|nr:pyrroline-5-carboxylate reductase [Aurantiacibacter spongiae]RPF72665.1 pyrroline-5-carboxylate reductase [Aurantiacibacter spongiae]